MATGTLSRGRALKLMGGALLGGVVASIPGLALAAPKKPGTGPCRPDQFQCGKKCCPSEASCVKGECVCPAPRSSLVNGACVCPIDTPLHRQRGHGQRPNLPVRVSVSENAGERGVRVPDRRLHLPASARPDHLRLRVPDGHHGLRGHLLPIGPRLLGQRVRGPVRRRTMLLHLLL